MATLTHVTFTGIDDFTDIRRAADIQAGTPAVEYGVLFSVERAGNDPRFPSVSSIGRIAGAGMRLSLHLCGALARKAVRGDFSEVEAVLGDLVRAFPRVQLNVSTYGDNPERLAFENPSWVKELIIQQKSVRDCGLYAGSLPRPGTAMLLDASGGRGLVTETETYPGGGHVGYAGGLGPDNVAGKLSELLRSPDVGPFWIDMETRVRTDDRFDLDKVQQVLRQVDGTLRLYKH